MKSMTGYANGEFETPALRFSLELKAYNNRYLEVFIQAPGYLSALEPRLRALAQSRARRGKLELSLRVRELKIPVRVVVDKMAAAAGIEALRELAHMISPSGEIALSDLLRMEGILSMERDIESDKLWEELGPALDELFSRFDAERLREGKNLESDMRAQIATIREGLRLINLKAPEMEAAIRDNLKKRFQETLGDPVDENRILQETAVALTRLTINEELTRLASHLDALESAIAGEGEPGKRIDFICQEINREVNTIGSKNQLTEVGRQVVLMKEAVENIREQARNIE